MRVVKIRTTARPVGKRHVRVTTSVSTGNSRRTKSRLIHI